MELRPQSLAGGVWAARPDVDNKRKIKAIREHIIVMLNHSVPSCAGPHNSIATPAACLPSGCPSGSRSNDEGPKHPLRAFVRLSGIAESYSPAASTAFV